MKYKCGKGAVIAHHVAVIHITNDSWIKNDKIALYHSWNWVRVGTMCFDKYQKQQTETHQ